jgi:quercetin dioxygenase-like cupin family protein
MSFFAVEQLPLHEVAAGIRMRSVNLENLMLTFVEYAPDAQVPTHRHRREQITYVIEGKLEVTVGKERRILAAGEGARIPRGVDHSSRPVGGPARVLDAWTPAPERFKFESLTTLGEHLPLGGESIR